MLRDSLLSRHTDPLAVFLGCPDLLTIFYHNNFRTSNAPHRLSGVHRVAFATDPLDLPDLVQRILREEKRRRGEGRSEVYLVRNRGKQTRGTESRERQSFGTERRRKEGKEHRNG